MEAPRGSGNSKRPPVEQCQGKWGTAMSPLVEEGGPERYSHCLPVTAEANLGPARAGLGINTQLPCWSSGDMEASLSVPCPVCWALPSRAPQGEDSLCLPTVMC